MELIIETIKELTFVLFEGKTFGNKLSFSLIDTELLRFSASCAINKLYFLFFFYFILFFIHLFMCAYTVWARIPCPLPVSSISPRFQAEPVLPFSPILLKRRHKQL
jgi:hypothetical protein